jgi:hypothetical protein
MANFSLVTFKGVGGGDDPPPKSGTPTVLKAIVAEDGRTLTGFKENETFQTDDDALIAELVAAGLAEVTEDTPIASEGVSCTSRSRRDGLCITGLADGTEFTETSYRNLQRLQNLYLIEGYEEPASGDLPE